VEFKVSTCEALINQFDSVDTINYAGGAVLVAAIGIVGLATVSVLNKEAGESMEMVC
jgi:hypothetical protein